MQIVPRQLRSRREPYPRSSLLCHLLLRLARARRVFLAAPTATARTRPLDARARRHRSFPNEIVLVRMVMIALLWDDADVLASCALLDIAAIPVRLTRKSLLNFPPEAVSAILIDGFDHEEDGADFEDGGADEGGDAAGVEAFVGEC